MLVKEKWAFVVDTYEHFWYLSWLCGWWNVYPFVVYPSKPCQYCLRGSAGVCLAVVLGHD